MSNITQFEKVVSEAGAEAVGIAQGPQGTERLIIQTPGGLITREVRLNGDLGTDIQSVAISAKQIVASARNLTAQPARNLSGSLRGSETARRM